MKTKFLLYFIFATLATLDCFAGPPPPPSGAGGAPPSFQCWPPPCVPIDGGISLLIAAGAIYGGGKLYGSNKQKNTI